MLLGIDVGGTKTALCLGTRTGELRARERFPTPRIFAGGDGDDCALTQITSRARKLAAASGIAWRDVRAAGLSIPGPVDRARGVLLAPPNLPGWRGANAQGELARALALPVHLENDADAAALAEWRFGAGVGARSLVYLTMSTGVGAGLLLDGRLHRGQPRDAKGGGGAGEFGHAPIEWDGELCACGQRGCLEAYIGGAAWAKRLAAHAPAASAVAKLAGGAAHARAEHVVAAARAGDAFALAEFARFNHYLAWGVTQLAYLLAPEVVVLGTIPSAAGEALCLRPVRDQVRARLWSPLADTLRIVPSGCGEKLPDYAGLSVALGADDDAGASNFARNSL